MGKFTDAADCRKPLSVCRICDKDFMANLRKTIDFNAGIAIAVYGGALVALQAPFSIS
ncbi:hypothetical protein NP603_01335 [Methylomonas sp. SURF-1]|uniref:Uncharacterized protein n=1 Tax=Methylomonas aurea TaxID=2952224 RepID=A0ABT1UBY5_9GAMM|nr:hypothetical protein [Methylomonas sp. SURF-1]MCQ8179738.1 hypothetical protein [Methylomonas sp. SURF-1]